MTQPAEGVDVVVRANQWLSEVRDVDGPIVFKNARLLVQELTEALVAERSPKLVSALIKENLNELEYQVSQEPSSDKE